jgi:hypothetical protein
MTAPITKLYERRDAIRHRLLELDVIESVRYRDWTVDGVATPTEERAKLNVERAQLRLEAESINQSLHAAKKAQTEWLKADFNRTLVGMLIERGDFEIIREARRRTGMHPTIPQEGGAV